MFLIVGCTKLKNGVPDRNLCFATLPELPAAILATEWLGRAKQSTDLIPARCLYAGAGWAAARRAQEAAAQYGAAHIGIISAGFGWLDEAEAVPCYSATFATGPDQVGQRVAAPSTLRSRHQAWWSAINEHRGLGPCPLTERLSSANRCIVAISADYLRAVEQDLRTLARNLGPERLYLLGIGVKPAGLPGELSRCRLPMDARLEAIVPGARASINQRALRWLIQEVVPSAGWDRAEIVKLIDARLSEVTVRRSARRTMLNVEIRQWIRAQLSAEPRISNAALLRLLRHGGRACEQSRFYELADAVRGATRT